MEAATLAARAARPPPAARASRLSPQRPGAGGAAAARRPRGAAGAARRPWRDAWVRGVDVDWARIFGGPDPSHAGAGGHVVLPPYAFQRERFWLRAGEGVGDVSGAGLGVAGHPLLGAVVELAGGDGLVLTGRLSLRTHPWLADHGVLGAVLLPGTALLELALRAGAEVGCEQLQELVLEAPLLSTRARCRCRSWLGAANDSIPPTRRTVSIHSRPEKAPDGEPWEAGSGWSRHASGVVRAAESRPQQLAALSACARARWGVATAGRRSTRAWESSSPDAVALELGGTSSGTTGLESAAGNAEVFYDHLAARGLEYGPTFQGLLGVWRHGDELLAEVALPAGTQPGAEAFGLHPALLDAALHALMVEAGAGAAATAGVRLPFSWSGVELHAVGAARLRVCLSLPGETGEGAVSILAADEAGGLVASVEALATRALSSAQLDGARRARPAHADSLYCLHWDPLGPLDPQPGARGCDAEVELRRVWTAPPRRSGRDNATPASWPGWCTPARNECWSACRSGSPASTRRTPAWWS